MTTTSSPPTTTQPSAGGYGSWKPPAGGAVSTGVAQGGAFPGTTPTQDQTDWLKTSGLSRSWQTATIVRRATDPNLSASRFAAEYQPKEIRTISQMLYEADNAQWDPAALDQVQQQLWAGGFFAKDASSKQGASPNFTPGQYDNATRTALVHAMQEASRQDTPFAQFLDDRARARTAALAVEGAAATRAPFSPKVDNPDDLHAGLRQYLTESLGQAPPDATIDGLVKMFQQQEVDSQKQNYDTTATGGVTTAAPTLQTFADQQAKSLDPTAYDANKVVSNLDYIAKKFGTQGA